jgi:hypothetical protein
MTTDLPYNELTAGRPAIYAPVPAMQPPPSEGCQIDWSAFLRMNLPAKPPVAHVNARQVLVGKAMIAISFAEEFPKLVKQWEDETSFHSSLGEKFTNEAYQRIMARGDEALPFILSDLQRNRRHWFYALEKIVGRDIASGAKNYAEARAAWLEWGYKNNHI